MTNNRIFISRQGGRFGRFSCGPQEAEMTKKFILKLEPLIENKTDDDLEEIDSKELIKLFLNEDNEECDIKLVLHCFCVAAVKFSVESSVESLVSRYETHFDKGRQLSESEADLEMEISENGPLIHRADPVIKRSLDNYFKDKNQKGHGRWHFVASSVGDMFRDSKTVRKLQTRVSKFPFLDI